MVIYLITRVTRYDPRSSEMTLEIYGMAPPATLEIYWHGSACHVKLFSDIPDEKNEMNINTANRIILLSARYHVAAWSVSYC